MAQISMQTDWRLTLTTAELRLILKALGGRLKPEVEPANALGDQLSRSRAHATTNAMHEADKLMQNLTS
jgi:hypothetical protein